MGLLTSFTRSDPGINQTSYWETVDGRLIVAASAVQTDRAYFMEIPSVDRADDFVNIYLYVGTTASANLEVCIYELGGVTLTKRATIGSTAVGGANARMTDTLDVAVTRRPGVRHFVSFACDSATPTFSRMNGIHAGVGSFGGRSYYKTGIGVGTMPATVAISDMSGGLEQTWWIAGD